MSYNSREQLEFRRRCHIVASLVTVEDKKGYVI